MFLPTNKWGPALEKHKKLREQIGKKASVKIGSDIAATSLWNDTKHVVPVYHQSGGYINPALTSHPSDPITQFETYI